MIDPIAFRIYYIDKLTTKRINIEQMASSMIANDKHSEL